MCLPAHSKLYHYVFMTCDVLDLNIKFRDIIWGFALHWEDGRCTFQDRAMCEGNEAKRCLYQDDAVRLGRVLLHKCQMTCDVDRVESVGLASYYLQLLVELWKPARLCERYTSKFQNWKHLETFIIYKLMFSRDSFW